MCGICGVLWRGSTEAIDRPVRIMMDALAHRGPDASGLHLDHPIVLGHRRLAILDPAGGHQPLSNEDGSLWIVFNGEIYNYLELRQLLVSRGHTLRTHTDTEVIVHLFEDEGERALQRLNGMFAFAIWDRNTRSLFLARDRFGIKPLYICENSDGLFFASEPKALLAAGVCRAEVDWEAFDEYLTFQFTLGEKTLFRGIRRLAPAHWQRADAGQTLAPKRYWRIAYQPEPLPEETFVDRLQMLLADSVRLQLRSDVPLGAHLSGGLDSAGIVGLASRMLDAPIHTFTGAFAEEGYDERAWVRQMTEVFPANVHEVVFRPEDFVKTWPEVCAAMDYPEAGPGVFPQLGVSRLAREHVKVVLGGQGGDEIFGGYARYLIAYLEQCIKGAIRGAHEEGSYVVTFSSILPNMTLLAGYEPLLQSFLAEELFQGMDRRYFRLINRLDGWKNLLDGSVLDEKKPDRNFEKFREIFHRPEIPSYFVRMTHFDMETLLPALLHVEDRVSMAASLESRVPFLDHRIMELVASAPPAVRFRGGESKALLRRALSSVLPESILSNRRKMGFPTPIIPWASGPLKGFVREFLLDSRTFGRGLWNRGEIEKLIDSERPYGRSLWGVLSLEGWFRTYVDGA